MAKPLCIFAHRKFTMANVGKISQIIGPVVDVSFNE
ncbi:MAG: hypothetical protein RIS28_682, partial [Bacteroidota bacterium]